MSTFTPALHRTRNFFELYQYACGDSEVPPIYHFWASVSLLAAVLENRVWHEKFKDEKLYPHLYIFLIGPGGLGKGQAISRAVKTVEKSVRLNHYRGTITHAHLIDRLGKSELDEFGRKILSNPKLWLIMDELKNAVGSNKTLAEAFIALMTELYTASNYPMQTGTRSSGEITVTDPILNWLAGSTENWLKEVITKDIVDSGFTARACFIFGKHDFNKRCPRIVYPPDYDEVMEHIQMRLWMLQATEGKMLMTSGAEAITDKWYMTRPNPTEEAMYSIWRRHHDMLLKFAMLNSLADGGPPVIRSTHLMKAKAMLRVTEAFSSRLLEVAHQSYDTKSSNEMEEYLRSKGEVDHSTVLRTFRRKRGMDAKKVRAAVFDLIQEGSVTASRNENKALIYHWVG